MVDERAASLAELARDATDVSAPARSLAAIAELRRRLDELEEFQVENALRRGWTWARIGAALGRTKQAAHKRYARLLAGEGGARAGRVVVTGDARRAVAIARAEAERVGAAVAPEHLAVGLAAVGAGGMDVEDARAAAARAPRRRGAQGAISPAARRVLEQSLRECVRRGDDELRPEHLALALEQRRGRNVRTGA